MNKKHLIEQAKKGFIHEFKTFIEIAKELSLSERTIRNWANDGGWEKAKEEFINKVNNISVERVEIVVALSKRIKEKIKSGETPTAHELNAYARLSENIVSDDIIKIKAKSKVSESKEKSVTPSTRDTLSRVFTPNPDEEGK